MDYFPENHSVHGRKNDLEVDNFLEHGSVFLGNEGRANTETILHRDETLRCVPEDTRDIVWRSFVFCSRHGRSSVDTSMVI